MFQQQWRIRREIKVEYTAKSGNLEARVNLPGISGTLLGSGRIIRFAQGPKHSVPISSVRKSTPVQSLPLFLYENMDRACGS